MNAEEEAAVFVLRPKPVEQGGGPEIRIVDFGLGFARAALRKGSRDASQRSFVRQSAKPLFWDTR